MKINPFLGVVSLVALSGCAIDPYDYKAPDPILWRAEAPAERAAPAVLVNVKPMPQIPGGRSDRQENEGI